MNSNRIISSIEVKGHPYGVLIMDNYSKEEIKFFFDSYCLSFGKRSHLDDKWFHWYYNMNPAGQCNQYILLDMLSNRWMGGIGFAKSQYLINSECNKGLLAVNGYINPGYENQGLYTRLFIHCLEQEAVSGRIIFGFTHSLNIASKMGVLKSGWKEYGRMTFYELKPIANLNINNGVVVSDNTMSLKNLDYERLEMKTNFSFSRSYDFVKWRFEDRPHKRYVFLILCNKKHMGYMILGFYTSSLRKKHCQVVDFRWVENDSFVPLINKAQEVAICESCDIMDILVMEGSETEKHCLEQNMIKREEGYDMFYYALDGIILPSECHVTYADNDVV